MNPITHPGVSISPGGEERKSRLSKSSSSDIEIPITIIMRYHDERSQSARDTRACAITISERITITRSAITCTPPIALPVRDDAFRGPKRPSERIKPLQSETPYIASSSSSRLARNGPAPVRNPRRTEVASIEVSKRSGGARSRSAVACVKRRSVGRRARTPAGPPARRRVPEIEREFSGGRARFAPRRARGVAPRARPSRGGSAQRPAPARPPGPERSARALP